MQRTQISLTEETRRLLDAEASRTGKSMAALIREAVEARYGHNLSRTERLRLLNQGFGAWKDHDEDGAAYVERVRGGRRLTELLERGR
jgi:hypothetical protein